MPTETKQAIDWALTQTYSDGIDTYPITTETAQPLVDKVREYFNTNAIEYPTFSYDDLKPYFN